MPLDSNICPPFTAHGSVAGPPPIVVAGKRLGYRSNDLPQAGDGLPLQKTGRPILAAVGSPLAPDRHLGRTNHSLATPGRCGPARSVVRRPLAGTARQRAASRGGKSSSRCNEAWQGGADRSSGTTGRCDERSSRRHPRTRRGGGITAVAAGERSVVPRIENVARRRRSVADSDRGLFPDHESSPADHELAPRGISRCPEKTHWSCPATTRCAPAQGVVPLQRGVGSLSTTSSRDGKAI